MQTEISKKEKTKKKLREVPDGDLVDMASEVGGTSVVVTVLQR